MRTAAVTIGLACLLAACESPQAGRPSESAPGPSPVADGPSKPAPAPTPEPTPHPDAAEPVLDEPAEDRALAHIEPVLEIPEEPRAPDDYGLLVPSVPPPAEEALIVHALAGYEVVAIYDRPDPDSAKLGYLRLGTRLMVTKKVGTEGCGKGWHALPAGGFACASKGLVVDAKRPPYLHRAPTPAKLDEPTPYQYAYVKRWNSPMWWRVPSEEEQARADAIRATREAEREGKPLPPAEPEPEPAKPESAKPEGTDLAALPSVDDPAPAEPKAEPAKTDSPATETPATDSPATDQAEPEPEPPKLPLSPETPWLEKGFFISLGEKITEGGKSYWYTSRGAYVPADAAYTYEAKDFNGVELGEESGFPFGYAMVKEAKVFELNADDQLKVVGGLERRTFVDLSEEIEISGTAYMMTTEGQLLRKKDLRLAEPQPVPEGIEPWERWVDVSLPKQMLVAYEGSRPVYVTLVSTGRKGTKEEPFDTPPGRYRIRSKHVSSTMDGDTASDGNYSIQDVPWAMFFEGSYALHGAFWHNGFGRVRSHGCVNLGPSDARWLFNWTTPFLPEGWHGVHAHEGSPGTTVIVRGE
ncbi:MAG: L,D-transpeptidase [Nannocystaceae bacterium]